MLRTSNPSPLSCSRYFCCSVRRNLDRRNSARKLQTLGPDWYTSKDDCGKWKRENGSRSQPAQWNRIATQNIQHLNFAVGANSFFPVLVFNDQLRGPSPARWPWSRKTGSSAPSRLSVHHLIDSPLKNFLRAKGSILPCATAIQASPFSTSMDTSTITTRRRSRLPLPGWRAGHFERACPARSAVRPTLVQLAGTISIGAAMQPIQIDQLVNGETKSMVMPPLQHAVGSGVPNLVPGPDVIIGDIEDVDQMGSNATQVGLAIGTDSCNNGDQPVDWFALPDTDHPVVPQNLYRMSGGADNTERFEQIGQSWMKHTFEALEETVCGTCNTSNCQDWHASMPGMLRSLCLRPERRPKQHRFARLGQSVHRIFPIDRQ